MTATISPLILEHAARLSQRYVQPRLIAIYRENDKGKAQQIGTGFLLDISGKPIVCTAKHVLHGHNYDEDPREKLIFHDGGLRFLSDLDVTRIIKADDHDIVAFRADRLRERNRFPSNSLNPNRTPTGSLATIHGYLARDFRRSGGILSPKPLTYISAVVARKPGYLCIDYPKHRNRDTFTHRIVMNATPEGLSGCPILDTAMLLAGRVQICGLLTDFVDDKGYVLGEPASRVGGLAWKVPDN